VGNRSTLQEWYVEESERDPFQSGGAEVPLILLWMRACASLLLWWCVASSLWSTMKPHRSNALCDKHMAQCEPGTKTACHWGRQMAPVWIRGTTYRLDLGKNTTSWQDILDYRIALRGLRCGLRAGHHSNVLCDSPCSHSRVAMSCRRQTAPETSPGCQVCQG
jgi:hypothetical protein